MKKNGVSVFLGLLIGATFGVLLGSANGNPLAGLGLGTLAGVFLGWFIAAIDLENKKSNKNK